MDMLGSSDDEGEFFRLACARTVFPFSHPAIASDSEEMISDDDWKETKPIFSEQKSYMVCRRCFSPFSFCLPFFSLALAGHGQAGRH